MKVLQTLLSMSLVASQAAVGAYKIRGAAEKALYYMTYLQEEVYTDVSKHRVAPGCHGTREGLRGQPNRCTLLEFLDHIWKSTKGDTKPDVSTVKAPASIQGANAGKLQAEQIASFVNSAQTTAGKKLPGYGYHGNCEIPKLLPGAVDYFDALPKFGKISADAANAAKSLTVNDFSGSDRERADALARVQAQLGKWNKEAAIAADVIINFRAKDKWDFLKFKGGLASKFGVEPVWSPKSAKFSGNTSNWFTIDVAKTIEKLQTEKGYNWLTARLQFYNEWRKIASSTGFGGHQSALFAAKYTRATMSC